MNALFFHCMRWSCFETVTFNVLLAAHTSLLFLVMPLSAYGIFGTTVALSYAIASFATIGNDVITGLLLTATPSYTSLRSTLCAHVLQAAVVGIVSCLCIYLFTATCWNTYNVTLRVLGISLANATRNVPFQAGCSHRSWCINYIYVRDMVFIWSWIYIDFRSFDRTFVHQFADSCCHIFF
jgi:hypothetical protein